jgi:hypothetical protein
MSDSKKTVDCYIYSFEHPRLDEYLERNGFCRGMIIFAIPDFGILFKCRVEGSDLDLEFGAFFALLRFIKKSLSKEKMDVLRIHSSNPAFVFSFTDQKRLFDMHPERRKLLSEYASDKTIAMSYIDKVSNKAIVPVGEYPCTPENQTPVIRPSAEDLSKAQFKPLQKGLHL